MVVIIKINSHPAQALVDSGSLGDFISSNLAQQLCLKKMKLAMPVNVNMVVQGSRTKVNHCAQVDFQYQEIREQRHFDIMNLSNYDVILGTPFLYQHQVSICLEPPAMIVGSVVSQPLKGDRVARLSSEVLNYTNYCWMVFGSHWKHILRKFVGCRWTVPCCPCGTSIMKFH